MVDIRYRCECLLQNLQGDETLRGDISNHFRHGVVGHVFVWIFCRNDEQLANSCTMVSSDEPRAASAAHSRHPFKALVGSSEKSRRFWRCTWRFRTLPAGPASSHPPSTSPARKAKPPG